MLISHRRILAMVLGIGLGLWTSIGQGKLAEAGAKTEGAQQADAGEQAAEVEGVRYLFPEGYHIGGRSAHLIKHPTEERWFLRFVPSEASAARANGDGERTVDGAAATTSRGADPFAALMEVLPGQRLEIMASIVNEAMNLEITFRVWGEVSMYHGANYVLPRQVDTLSLFGKRAKDEAKSGFGLSLLESALGGRVSRGQSEAEEEEEISDKETLREELRRELLSMPRPRPLRASRENVEETPAGNPDGAGGESAGPGSSVRSDLKEGQMIIDRLGRLDYDAGRQDWLFAFEAQGGSVSKSPIVVLPNQLLELMEQVERQSLRSVVFRISGQVTKYYNRNYLLLRKALVVTDRGNLGKSTGLTR